MFENSLVIAGQIASQPVRKTSPAGIEHCYLVLEHSSEQLEAGLVRRVWCKIRVIASGQPITTQTNNLQLGMAIRVTGFIQRQEMASGVAQLVIHAKQIERLD
ncbi:primosomal replication protein N [Catenovulum adriaticum]|uniref:Replication restart protein PriB n=1 Tax=Catenovulum adriaticum TaxID=2984846 RepID=A0ABY7AN76_9ALTE|nr:primosomal replication protein N [Catenovulum sp. TS8]WAJ69910.1 primosomal replication protein N [Catenovulum sp. TS8]